MYMDLIAPPRTKPLTPQRRRRRRRRHKGKTREEAADNTNEMNATAHPQNPQVLDPSTHNQPPQTFLYDTERIAPCAKNNILLQAVIAPMPGLHFGTPPDSH